MARKWILAWSVLGVFFAVAAGSSQAGWSGHSESTQPGESMSSDFGTTGENWVPSGSSSESMEFSEYQKEEALETGRLPESGRSETSIIFGDDVERQLREGSLPGGGP